jgi:hypothetical protein
VGARNRLLKLKVETKRELRRQVKSVVSRIRNELVDDRLEGRRTEAAVAAYEKEQARARQEQRLRGRQLSE